MKGEKPMTIERQCPVPINEYPTVLMAHGGGGRLTNMLVERMFAPAFANPALDTLHDGAVLEVGEKRLAFATDAFTISPLFFPGGNIGSLAVHGTVNDLAMCGAMPLALSTSFILEEGLPMEDLWRIVQAMQEATQAVGVPIVTGDTKVVDRNKGDGIFITTTGIGHIADGVDISPRRVVPGDVVLVSGAIAVHGIAILSLREGLEFETTLESDTAPLHTLVARLLAAGGPRVHALRDPTRGGLSSALNEIAAQAQVGIQLEEKHIPLGEEVRGACEILGLDPLYVANEGKCLAIVASDVAEEVLAAMRSHPLGGEAAAIGQVVDEHAGRVVLRSRVGGKRVVDMLSGEQLPRIC
jgi:hydrogenase expression/formation protein HypE